jgi:hypothetical protein
MKHWILTIMALIVCIAASAQKADKTYTEAKALYDAKNYTAAFPLLKKAAEKGHKKAQYRLGRCYDKGHGVAEDNAAAFQWYKKSAAQDYAKAQYALGKCYLKGKAVAADQKQAKTWLKKAVKNVKGGDEVLAKIKKEADEGDETAKAILSLIK